MADNCYGSLSRAHSTQGSISGMSGGAQDPFSTPPRSPYISRAPSTYSKTSGFVYAHAPGTQYFKSRRIRKGENPLPVVKKQFKERLTWIFPVGGFVLGLCLTGLIVYLKIRQNTAPAFCPVLDEDFSSGTLDPNVWTKEIESGGFGNQEFEQTTDDEDVVFISNGQLTIKPKLQDAQLMEENNVIDLLADGTCTSTIWENCVSSTNTTNGTIVQPVLSARLNTKLGATIQYGKIEVRAKIAKGDWLWPAIWMLPVTNTYGAWPRSGEIDIMESRGNNYSYSLGGNQFVNSALHWGPDADNDAYRLSRNNKPALHSELGDKFHTFGMEWTDKYLFTYLDNVLHQVMYYRFNSPLYPKGYFPNLDADGNVLTNPWAATGRTNSPFDQQFYLIINVAVGSQNGWFLDGADGKPWVDASPTAKKDFWDARDQWYPTWEEEGSGSMVVDSVKMWKLC